jgi:hypothetical protein
MERPDAVTEALRTCIAPKDLRFSDFTRIWKLFHKQIMAPRPAL